MKCFILASACAFLFVQTTFSQIARDNISYSPPVQIDSSNNYIIASLIDQTNKTKYNFTSPYTRMASNWTNIYIYNTHTNESKKIFPNDPVLVFPLSPNNSPIYVSQQEIRFSFMTKNSIIFFVKNNDYNTNGIIDDDDPTSLYILSKTGTNLTQVSPKDMNVINCTVSRDGETILVKLQKDNNNDKKFLNEDELLYQITLDKDYSKIKAFPVKLQ